MQKETLQENKMGVMPVGKLLVNMALPMIISMLVQAFYNIVDSVYVSQVSESAVTALSLAFPVQNMQIGFAVGVGVGVNALLSQSLGRKDQESVNWAAGQGVFLALVATALFMLFGFFGVRPYYTMQSTVAETVEGGIAYTSICCIFTVGVFIQVLCERLLQATGRAMQTMILQGTGAIINIILDPVFIHGWWGMPRMGVAGAAVATVIGQCTGAVLGIYLNLRHNPEVQLHVKFMKPNWKVIAPILEVGIPSVVMNGIGSVMNFGMNQILQGFNEVATGVFGIYYKLQSLFFMPLFGINNATISVISVCIGAGRTDQARYYAQKLMRTANLFLIGMSAIMIAGSHFIVGIFQLSPEASKLAIQILCYHAVMAVFLWIPSFSLPNVFRAAGDVFWPMAIAIFSMWVFRLGMSYVLGTVLTMGLFGIWMAMSVDWLFRAVCYKIRFQRGSWEKKI